MEKIIAKLTEEFKFGSDIILLLILSDETTSIHYLDYLNITGKELENLKNCMPEFSLQYIKETIRFLRSGFISIEDIHENLKSSVPTYFIPRLLITGEDWEWAYEQFTCDFYTRFHRFKSR